MRNILVLIVFACLFFSCNEEKSSNADIIDFTITNLSNGVLVVSDIEINADINKIYIFFDNDLFQHTFPLNVSGDLKLSSGAKTNSFMNGKISFSSPNEVKHVLIEAEDGTQKDWYISLIHKQIQNSDFENWFTNVGMNGKDVYSFNKSGRRFLVRSNDCFSFHSSIFLKFPDNSTSGTFHPLYSAGRV